MRYVLLAKLADGSTYYRFNPPSHYVSEGVVHRCNLGTNKAEAYKKGAELNLLLNVYEKEQKLKPNAVTDKTLNGLVHDYYLSYEFNELRDETKSQYKYFLGILLDTVVNGRSLRLHKYNSITTGTARTAYEMWCKRGIYMANHVMSCSRVVYSHGINRDYCEINPFSNVKKYATQSRKVVWTREDVCQFLDVAYRDFQMRNIGLIAQMSYEWCQRVGDMRLLQWSSLDLPKQRVNIEQSKRRARVFLPIEDDLCEMLREQENDFGFQEWVVPKPKPIRGSYDPYSLYELPRQARRVMIKAGLSEDLRLSDLRRTGTMEMVDAGVSMGQIMSVTGHVNPQSVKPYLKNTFASANNALKLRKENING